MIQKLIKLIKKLKNPNITYSKLIILQYNCQLLYELEM